MAAMVAVADHKTSTIADRSAQSRMMSLPGVLQGPDSRPENLQTRTVSVTVGGTGPFGTCFNGIRNGLARPADNQVQH
jgi:hypothetical protein